MKILAVSDLHGSLPTVPKCDLLLVGGDICPMWDHNPNSQRGWLDTNFRNWLTETLANVGAIIGIAGNHDFVFEYPALVGSLHLPWIYLRDSGVTQSGLKIYGLPWVPNLVNWAFYANKEQLALRYNAVPKDADIVISHGPPFGMGDFSVMGNIPAGCKAANDMLRRVRPQAYICGHIHEGFGHYRFRPQHGDPVDVYNVSYVDEDYNVRGSIADTLVEIPVDIMIDATEEQTDIIGTVCNSDTDARQPQE